ncbi:MAG: rod shape-determining protein RodA [Bacteroidetes bacterium]|jgi:rod shape determining protein RodA|nr:rod shape-determining protein RodA [Bacteroidota bacterium]MCL5034096.1 rod shape-determining protein RodA [Bacteroidota bacterium]
MFDFFKENFDYKTFALALILGCIGVLAVNSATYNSGMHGFFVRDIVWQGVGVIVALMIMFLSNRFLQNSAYFFYALTILLLIFVLVAGKRVASHTSWLGFLGIGGQPSELAKVASILCLSKFLSENGTERPQWQVIIISAGIVGLPMILTMLQPDLGTTIVYLAIFFPILFWAGLPPIVVVALVAPVAIVIAEFSGTVVLLITVVAFGVLFFLLSRKKLFAITLSFVAVSFGLFMEYFYKKLLQPHQQKRIQIFLNPSLDPQGAGYNALQARVAIGSGGLFGKGYLRGAQTQLNFVPARWTDFIFTVIGEEFGFVGAAVTLLAFGALFFRGVKIAEMVKTKFASLAAIGITSVLLFHVFINIGMNINLAPIVGIPLPFISYGGSSALSDWMMVGILLNFYAHRKEH